MNYLSKKKYFFINKSQKFNLISVLLNGGKNIRDYTLA